MLHDFVASTLVDATGKEGMKFFPLVFSLFMFVLTANLLGMIPGFFTVTSHIIVTFALAMLVIGTVVIYGFMKHGTHFLGLFVPSGVPGWLLPFIVVIELISFLSRPISLQPASLREHARGTHRAEGFRRLRRQRSSAPAVP